MSNANLIGSFRGAACQIYWKRSTFNTLLTSPSYTIPFDQCFVVACSSFLECTPKSYMQEAASDEVVMPVKNVLCNK